MKFTITYQYDNGTFDSEYKEFEDFESAEYYADKQKIERNAKEVYVR